VGWRASTVGRWARSELPGCVTAALWTGARAWMTGALLYLPKEWLSDRDRRRAHIPAGRGLQEKWSGADVDSPCPRRGAQVRRARPTPNSAMSRRSGEPCTACALRCRRRLSTPHRVSGTPASMSHPPAHGRPIAAGACTTPADRVRALALALPAPRGDGDWRNGRIGRGGAVAAAA